MKRLLTPIILLMMLIPGMSHSQGEVCPPIRGVTVLAPPRPVTGKWADEVRDLGANWVAIIPYALSRLGDPAVHYEGDHNFWGFRPEGIQTLIRQARKAGLRVMVKPMVRVPGSWPGGYEPGPPSAWRAWELNYRKYILDMARLAEENGAEIFTIGTEFVAAIRERPQFWKALVAEIREVFKGQLTYAANWDNFEAIPFWNEMDYIGIDAYFPLDPAPTPDPEFLSQKWEEAHQSIRDLSRREGKQVIFTEFGYRSIDHCAWKQWELEALPESQGVNLNAQAQGYEGVFQGSWHHPWIDGGFIWYWNPVADREHAPKNSGYSPQHKPAEAVIKKWFSGGS